MFVNREVEQTVQFWWRVNLRLCLQISDKLEFQWNVIAYDLNIFYEQNCPKDYMFVDGSLYPKGF